MPTFDADQWRASRERWGVRIDGREYLAEPVSAERVVRAQLEMQGASGPETRAILLRLLRRAFPWRVSMRWLGDPVRRIADLPAAAFTEVIRSFFAWVTGNPVTPSTVMGQSPPTSSSPAAPSPTAATSPPMP